MYLIWSNKSINSKYCFIFGKTIPDVKLQLTRFLLDNDINICIDLLNEKLIFDINQDYSLDELDELEQYDDEENEESGEDIESEPDTESELNNDCTSESVTNEEFEENDVDESVSNLVDNINFNTDLDSKSDSESIFNPREKNFPIEFTPEYFNQKFYIRLIDESSNKTNQSIYILEYIEKGGANTTRNSVSIYYSYNINKLLKLVKDILYSESEKPSEKKYKKMCEQLENKGSCEIPNQINGFSGFVLYKLE